VAPDRWQQVGYVGVDAGLVILADPCYLADGKGPLANWGAFCDRLDAAEYFAGGDGPDAWTYQVDEPGVTGVVVRSGYGDGRYPVYVRRDADGLPVAAMVVFDDERPEVAE
jgi:hypothetical protein